MAELIRSINKRFSLDFIGMILSFTCSIHCALLPLFMVFKPVWSESIIYSEGFENSIIISSIVIASFALGSGFKKHKNIIPVALMIFSFALLFVGKTFHEIESIFVPMAGIALFFAHMRNHKYLHSAA